MSEREYKFRQPVFDDSGVFKKWHYWGFMPDCETGDICFFSPYSQELFRFNSQQYTGLNDSEGTDIYDGDIVLFTNAAKVTRCCMVEWGGIVPGFMLQDIYNEHWCEFDFVKAGLAIIQIIGNIHQNPELIEKTS